MIASGVVPAEYTGLLADEQFGHLGKLVKALIVDGALRHMATGGFNCGVNHHDSDFSASVLTGAQMQAADLTGSIFDNAIMIEADLSAANLTNVSFRDVRLAGANLSNAIGIETANFEGACGSNASLLPEGLVLPDCESL